MPAPAAMRQTAQFGTEATYGAGATITRRFTSFGLGRDRNMSAASTTPRGQTAATQGWIAFEDSSFDIDNGVLSYDEVVYLLESAVKKVTATTPAGGTTSRQRVYSVDQFAADAFQSYKIEQGDINRNRGGAAVGCFVNEWGFEVSSTEETVDMSGSLLGGKLADGTMTTTGITTTDFRPCIPSQCTVGYATTFAGLSAATNITNSFTAGFTIGDRRSLVRYLGNATGGPSDVVETVPSLEFDLTLADEAAPVDSFLTNARAGTKQFFRIKFTGPIIETTIPYTFQLDLCAVLRDGPGDDEEDDVQVVNFPYQAAYDSVSGKIFEITVINTLATL